MADNSDPKAARTTEPVADASDIELAARAAAGDESAFEVLFERHRRRVSLIAGRFFRQREQIEEVVQETFTKVYFALADFDGEGDASFAAWLARIAFNASYDELRRQKRRPESALSEVSEDESEWLRRNLHDESAESDIERVTVSRDLAAKLLARLGPEDRLVLVLLEVEGQSVAEIGQTLGWSVPKVKVRAHRARAALRKVLGRYL